MHRWGIAGRGRDVGLASGHDDPAALGEEGRAKIGMTDGLVRISAGIEDAEDLLEDLEQALSVL